MITMISGQAGLLLVAAAAVVLAALVVFLWSKYRRAARSARAAAGRAAAAEAKLAALPHGCLDVTPSDEKVIDVPTSLRKALKCRLDASLSLADVLAAFEPRGAERLAEAINRLCASGWEFSLTVARDDGARLFEVHGARIEASGDTAAADLLWVHDVTELTQAVTSAKAEVDSVTRLLDALPVPMWRRDAELRLTYCNAAYARAVDTSAEAAVGDAVELLGKAKSQAARAIGRRAMDAGAPVSETHHVVVDGARRLFDIEERPFGDGTLIGHAVDVTRAEEAENELARHTGAHDSVLELLGSAIAIFGPDLRLKFFNNAYARLWGLEEAFLSSEPEIGDILEALREARRLPEHANFPEFKRQWMRSLQSVIDPVEDLLHLPDGSTLRSVISPHPFGGVFLTYEDVTDRLSLERSYNTLIEVQRETLDNLYEGVAVYGADGRLKLSNPAFSRIWKVPSDVLTEEPHVRELVERSRKFFDVDDERWHGMVEARVAEATEPGTRSGRRERADGSVIDWAQVPLPDGASLFTFLDVTDSIRVERVLRERNEALETADRLKSEFIANISYELRTPLNAIVGFSEILENQYFGTLNPRQLEYSQGIVEASQRLTALINDILDLATIEAGYMELDLSTVDVHEMIESVYVLGQERARSKNITLTADCPADIGTLPADARRLKQALFNLLSNAFKFTPKDGEVTLSAKRVDAELQLTVSDTGVGIRSEDLGRVFGTFERGASQGPQSGAGLGLSLVKSLIELHGGRVEIESGPDQGTRVICHVPFARAEAAPAEGRQQLRA